MPYYKFHCMITLDILHHVFKSKLRLLFFTHYGEKKTIPSYSQDYLCIIIVHIRLHLRGYLRIGIASIRKSINKCFFFLLYMYKICLEWWNWQGIWSFTTNIILWYRVFVVAMDKYWANVSYKTNKPNPSIKREMLKKSQL